MKKVLSILTITTILILTTACGNKEKITTYQFKDNSAVNSMYYLTTNTKTKEVTIKQVIPCKEEGCTPKETEKTNKIPDAQFTKLEKVLEVIEPDDLDKNMYLKNSLIGALNNIAFGDKVLCSRKDNMQLFNNQYMSSDANNDGEVTYLEYGDHTLDGIISTIESGVGM